MTQASHDKPFSRLSWHLLIFSFILVGFICLLLMWQVRGLVLESGDLWSHELRSRELCERVAWLDEVLTMSARMCAQTEDPDWERRYRRNAPRLAESLEEIEARTANKESKAIKHLIRVHRALLAMEERSFELVENGQAEEAKALLINPRYLELKNNYDKYLQRLRQESGLGVSSLAAHLRDSANWFLRGTILALALLVLFWLFLLRALQLRQMSLQEYIYELKRMERDHHEQGDILKTFVAHTPVALAMLNRDFDFMQTSDKWVKDYHKHDPNIIGKNFCEAWGISAERKRALERVLSGIPEINEGERFVVKGKERWFRSEHHPWFRSSGEIGGLIMFVEDVTRRKAMDEALKAAKEKYRLLIEHLPDYVQEMDKQGKLLYANRRLPMADAEARTVFEALPRNYHRRLSLIMHQAFECDLPVSMDVMKHDGESRRWYQLRLVSINEENRLLLICTDITKKKESEKEKQEYRKLLEKRVRERTTELEVANEEVKSFAYIISHDLRAPLVNIRGFVGELRFSFQTMEQHFRPLLGQLNEGLARDLTLIMDEDVPEAIQFIETSVKRMDQLIGSVLKLSRMGRKELCFSHVNVQEIVDQCLQNLAFRIEKENIEVTVESLPSVMADATAMVQIWGNLLTNAVIYLDPNRRGLIRVGGERSTDHTLYWVEDNGRGIEPDDIPKVFEIFRRVGRQDTKGEGMGMAYVKMLVSRHGGKISCESHPGKGTIFYFTISHHLDESSKPDLLEGQVQAES